MDNLFPLDQAHQRSPSSMEIHYIKVLFFVTFLIFLSIPWAPEKASAPTASGRGKWLLLTSSTKREMEEDNTKVNKGKFQQENSIDGTLK